MIMSESHAFSGKQLPHAAQELLAIFLGKGQIDMDKYIDRKTRKVRGDIKRGARSYQ